MRGLLRVATITLILSDSSDFLLVEHSFLLLRELNPFRSRGADMVYVQRKKSFARHAWW